ncbi:MAG: hypothetical protein AB1478_06575 [Nitrospirota bacterium]
MVFAYYKRLTVSQKHAYDKSDGVTSVRIPNASELHPLVNALETSLKKEDRKRTEILSQKLISALTARLKVPAIRVKVLAVRPHNSRGELHGLYNPRTGQLHAIMDVWMRTAQQKRVVAFKTFLRTLLHEICHHLDYEYFRFSYSFHTEGFYKRESSLFHQLVDK